ncbi:hypothetical protein P8629_07850 [Hydrogenovibrio sp. 3SP14C1]|uniref:hypothetical protein n=1 Tax=Hydrogenovibrio sp. 3SP14C1 TaxID=3038774 RepID=UPI00241654D4|nr:hypothetical protein [Hydrogenovibrio sp. 3SP14C1]MDG4812919.1 hypothetical protein [Hydrogenovibrio sp. 3SP14C1]
MKKITFLVSIMLMLFTFQTIAEAASISTRVRILEGKVYKQSKLIKQQARQNRSNSQELKNGLKDIEQLKLEVKNFMSEQEAATQKKQKTSKDKRYSFP